MPDLFIPQERLPEIGSRGVLHTHEGPICVIRTTEGVFAIEDLCKHMDEALSPGELQGTILACPVHGWEYDVRTGKCVAPTWGKQDKDIRGFPVEECDGGYRLRLPGSPEAGE